MNPPEPSPNDTTAKPSGVTLMLLGGREATVRGLSWKHSREFASLLGTHAGELMESLADGGGIKALALGKLDAENLAEILSRATALADFLVRKCAGLNQEQADDLQFAEAITILGIAVRLTFPDAVLSAVGEVFIRAMKGQQLDVAQIFTAAAADPATN
jgi:hypothetical protein